MREVRMEDWLNEGTRGTESIYKRQEVTVKRFVYTLKSTPLVGIVAHNVMNSALLIRCAVSTRAVNATNNPNQ